MPQISEVDAATAHQWSTDGDAIIVDVREHQELAQARVDGAVHVPLSAFDPSQLPTDSGKKIIFVCAHGHRSMQISQYLTSEGLLHEAFNLTGGIAAWVQAGLPLQTSAA